MVGAKGEGPLGHTHTTPHITHTVHRISHTHIPYTQLHHILQINYTTHYTQLQHTSHTMHTTHITHTVHTQLCHTRHTNHTPYTCNYTTHTSHTKHTYTTYTNHRIFEEHSLFSYKRRKYTQNTVAPLGAGDTITCFCFCFLSSFCICSCSREPAQLLGVPTLAPMSRQCPVLSLLADTGSHRLPPGPSDNTASVWGAPLANPLRLYEPGGWSA